MTRSAGQLGAVVTLHGGCVLIAVDGDLDVATAPRYEALVRGILGVPGIARIDVDCGRLAFVDSAGLRALLRSRVATLNAGVPWYLGPTSKALRRVLDLVSVGALHDSSLN